MNLPYHILDVFTDTPYAGNPLAVVLQADALSPAQMLAVAREFNLSETVFVRAPRAATAAAQLRIYTPARELPFAGHPTVGAACLLSELGLAPQAGDEEARFVLEEGIGPVAVGVRRRAGQAPYAELTTAQLPEYGPTPDEAAVAAILGLQRADLGSDGERVRAVSCGVPFVLVPLRAPELLASIALDGAAWHRHLAGQWAQQLYVYARGYEGELRARMFAPGLGVAEDPATGSAAAALAGALASESPQAEGRLQWLIRQGLEMGRPSELHVCAERAGGAVAAIRVGGHAVRVASGTLFI
ncbi:PhzF family phenazine biosynthesis protein [Fontimonas sp. SYSU GA230001]|uniref:PhzF family phenazine biosynthesis protein n=1 Tax=Fontimonas sp. SYSU GA230001 TaxID=3142450 RepID=UPI0032B612EB